MTRTVNNVRVNQCTFKIFPCLKKNYFVDPTSVKARRVSTRRALNCIHVITSIVDLCCHLSFFLADRFVFPLSTSRETEGNILWAAGWGTGKLDAGALSRKFP